MLPHLQLLDYHANNCIRYSSLELLQIGNCSTKVLPKCIWDVLKCYKINKRKPTKRGCRAGNHVKQYRYSSLAKCRTTALRVCGKTHSFLQHYKSRNKQVDLEQKFKFLVINARSICNKMKVLKIYISHYRPTFIGITESWANEKLPDSFFQLAGYNLFRKDRHHRIGGGVLLYVDDQLSCAPVDHLCNHNFEDSVWCQVFINQNISILVAVVYRAPSNNPVNDKMLLSLLSQVSSVNCTYKLIAGDFNLPDIDWDNLSYGSHADNFMDAIFDLNLSQHVMQPTRKDAVLDLLFSSDPSIVCNVDILEPLGNSDHNMLLAELNFFLQSNSRPVKFIRDYQRANWSYFAELITMVDWKSVFESGIVNTVWERFCFCLNEAMDFSIPYKKQASTTRPLWETAAVRFARVYRNRAERMYLACKTVENKKLRNETSQKLRNEIKKAVKNFETKISNNKNVKPFWHYVKSSRKSKPTIGPLVKNTLGNLSNSDKECAQVLSDFFSSVFTDENTTNIPFAVPQTTDELVSLTFSSDLIRECLAKTKNFSATGPDNIPYVALKAGGPVLHQQLCHLFQLCLVTATTPTQWKTAHVIPVFKKGNRRDVANYRPISLTSCVCKLMESCLKKAIWQFWEERDLIKPTQFGFVPQSSCVAQLLEFLESITCAVDENQLIDVVYLDFSKAFNSVPHERLLRKLSSLGIKGKLLNWIRSFLFERYEIVCVNESKSSPKPMTSGVPQGSCIGPLLFIAYVNDIDLQLKHCKMAKYADDIKIYKNFPKHNFNSEVSKIQNDLNAIMEWAADWQLSFNINKCSVLHFGHHNSNHNYNLGRSDILAKNCEKDLGVLIRDDLKFSTHVTQAVNKAESALGVLRRFVISRDKKIFLNLYKSLVRPHLEYATTVWNPYLKRDIQLIERVQKRATKCIHGLHDLPYDQRLLSLNLDSLEKRRLIVDLTEIFKITHKMSILHSSTFFSFVSDSRTRGHNFKVFKKIARLNCRKYFFSQRCINVWNKLPWNVVNSVSVSQFKRLVSQYC